MLRVNTSDFWCATAWTWHPHGVSQSDSSDSMMQFRSFKFKLVKLQLHRTCHKSHEMPQDGCRCCSGQHFIGEPRGSNSDTASELLDLFVSSCPHARNEIPCGEIRFADVGSRRVALLSKMDCGNRNPRIKNNSLGGWDFGWFQYVSIICEWVWFWTILDDFGMLLRLYLQYHGLVGVALPIFLLFALLLALLAKLKDDPTQTAQTCWSWKLANSICFNTKLTRIWYDWYDWL